MANLDFYGMYDFAEGDTEAYQYTSTEWRALIKALSGTGIAINAGAKFASTASGLAVTVGNGTCFIEGQYGYNISERTITLDAESVSLQRIDRIVLVADVTGRTIALEVKKGTASGNPVAPTLTQTELLYELPVYQAKVTNGSAVTLTDERTYIYTPTEINTKLNAILSGTSYVYAVYAE